MSDAAMSTAAAATGSAGHVSTMAAVGLAVAAGAAALYSIIALEKPLRPQPPMARRRRGGRAGVRAMRREHEERQQQQQQQQQQELEGKQQLDDDDAQRRLPSPAPSDIAEPDDDAPAAVNRARTPSPVAAAAPVHLSQLDADSLDSELAKTDAKLRRLLVRKERLELRRTQLSVTAMHRPPSTGPAASAATDIIDHADADPAHNDEDIAWGHAPVSLATTTASPLSPSPTDTTGTSLASPRPYESTVPRRARRVSHTSSTDSANGSALSTSPTAPAVFPSHSSDSSESGGNEVDAMAQLQQDLEDDRDDVLSALSDDSDLASSFISDLSLGSDFSLLSEARYGRPAS